MLLLSTLGCLGNGCLPGDVRNPIEFEFDVIVDAREKVPVEGAVW